MKEITTQQLAMIFNKIIKKLEFEGFDKIILTSDFYRFIPTDKWDSFDSDSIEVGSLYDDIENLIKLSGEEKRPCTYVDFDRMASLLRAISQSNNPIN